MSLHPITHSSDSNTKAQQKQTVCIAAIVKNEAPYILEWVAWHRNLGVSKFFICDNDSDDGTTEILKALQDEGIIFHIPFPTEGHVSPQLQAYKHLLSLFGDMTEWIAFIDADEFISPSQGLDLGAFLNSLSLDVGAVALNWAVYGSSRRTHPGKGLVTQRFNRRARIEAGVNQHYKSVLRTAAYSDTGKNSHHFRLREGFCYVDVTRKKMEVTEANAGKSSVCVWGNLRINHYVIKSWDEFWAKKVSRGRASAFARPLDESFFRQHDLNSEIDDVSDSTLSTLTKTYNLLRQLLKEKYNLKYDTNDHLSSVKSLVDPPRERWASGALDIVEIRNGKVMGRGWAATSAHRPVPSIKVYCDGTYMQDAKITRVERLDVVRAYPQMEVFCGFNFSFDYDPAKLGGSTPEIRVEASIHDIQIGQSQSIEIPREE